MMEYTLKRSRRAKYMRLTVQPGGVVILTAPSWSSDHAIRRFLKQHHHWLDRAINRMKLFKRLPVSGRRDYLRHKEEARTFITERVDYWNTFYQFQYGRIAIKNTKRLWGSCSHKGNLNFSFTLLFLPRELADYVVVHELCHLAERNHGNDFWQLVEKTLPDFALRRQELRKYLPR